MILQSTLYIKKSKAKSKVGNKLVLFNSILFYMRFSTKGSYEAKKRRKNIHNTKTNASNKAKTLIVVYSSKNERKD